MRYKIEKEEKQMFLWHMFSFVFEKLKESDEITREQSVYKNYPNVCTYCILRRVTCHIPPAEREKSVDKVCQCAYWVRRWVYVNLVGKSLY